MNQPSEEFIRYALEIGALELVPEGRELKSGRISPYFFNSGLFSDGASLWHLAKAYAAVISGSEYQVDMLFGPAYKGIPLVATVSMALHTEHGITVEYAFNRKEKKDHGDKGLVVGASLRGTRVVIVDDVITSGGSANEAVRIIRAQGGTPVGCVIAFDRQERGTESALSAVQEFQKKHGIPVRAIATLDNLIEVLKPVEIVTKILAYRKEFGATTEV